MSGPVGTIYGDPSWVVFTEDPSCRPRESLFFCSASDHNSVCRAYGPHDGQYVIAWKRDWPGWTAATDMWSLGCDIHVAALRAHPYIAYVREIRTWKGKPV